MAKSRRKRRAEARQKDDAKKFWRVVGISVLVLLVMLFMMFQNS